MSPGWSPRPPSLTHPGRVTHICVSKLCWLSVNRMHNQLLICIVSLQWWHNERDGDSNHRGLHCLLNRLFRHKSKETSKLRVTGLCEGKPPLTGGFPSQRASDAENVSIWWCHHGKEDRMLDYIGIGHIMYFWSFLFVVFITDILKCLRIYFCYSGSLLK